MRDAATRTRLAGVSAAVLRGRRDTLLNYAYGWTSRGGEVRRTPEICAAFIAIALGSCSQPLCGCTPPELVGDGPWRGAVMWPAGTLAPESLTVTLRQEGDRVSGAGSAYFGAPSRPVAVAGRAGLYQLTVDLTITGWRHDPSRFVATPGPAARYDTLSGTLESPTGEHAPVPLRLVRVLP